MYKVIVSVTVIATLITVKSFAQEFSFKPPVTTGPTATANGATIPTRSGTMSPDSFKKNVSSTTQNRSNTVNNLAGQKLKNNPEYSMPVSKGQKFSNQPTGVVGQPTISKQPINKPAVQAQEQPEPIQEHTPRDNYTGFSGQAPASGTSTPSNNNQNSSGGFGNIYQ